MPPLIPLSHPSRVVASAIVHHRELRQLTRDELSYVLSDLGHELDVDDLRAIEQGASIITVE
ncbi:hypothetical protein HG717_06900 [Rhodococcus erythropolis]|uniref:hypothetical protein n=1 Tax=Rhodococcus TaxID=1827 RepID=UPI001C71163B|nr:MULTISPECIES: hypothetical protein [Rhodococcus]MBY6383641.1 hypothetical protein [Rhodococcus erythropolis]